jgi:hypothetical protein
MNGFSNLIVGIFSSVIATILTSFVWLMWNRSKRKDILWDFLGLNRGEETWVCYGNVQKENLLNTTNVNSRSYTTFEYGDIASVLLMFDRLKSTYAAKVKHSVGVDFDIVSQGNVVSIGGPKWNKVTEKLLGKIGSPLYFNRNAIGVIEKRRTHQNENIYSPEICQQTDDSLKVRDYGFIICSRACYLDHRIPCAIVIAGFSTAGVLIATQFLISMSTSDIRILEQRLKNDKRFGLLIEGIVERDSHERLMVSSSPKLVSWIPEQDFTDPFQYIY